MEQGQRTHKTPKAHHPHHVVPKHESGYTDEVAEECHDLIDKAEEDAHLHDPNSMYSTTDKPEHVHRAKGKGGLEGSGSTGKGAGQKIQETGKNVTESIGETMGEVKKKMGMGK